ncbi:hypothetical protein ACN28E_13270 [Archangium lansingense]|uniref:hypothetical protein n=1 Tax=Archangium lansingense TaxID=2995310 RepID=UPI003B79FC35
MLSNMPKAVFNGLAALTVAIPVLAWSNILPVHNVRSSALYFFHESNYTQNQHTNHTVTGGFATFSWQENTLQGFGNLRTKVGNGDMYELRMVRITSTDSQSVNGEWDVFKNGDPTCAGCKGSLYVSPPGIGTEYLKGYVDNGKVGYSFAGNLDANTRYDY